jgi:hypothetical protein
MVVANFVYLGFKCEHELVIANTANIGLCFICVGTCDIIRPTLVLVLIVSDGWHHPSDSVTIL